MKAGDTITVRELDVGFLVTKNVAGVQTTEASQADGSALGLVAEFLELCGTGEVPEPGQTVPPGKR